MRRKIAKVLATATLCGLVTIGAAAACTKAYSDYDTCVQPAYYRSDPNFRCYCTSPVTADLGQEPHAGFLTTETDGHVLITRVFRDAPAAAAAILARDGPVRADNRDLAFSFLSSRYEPPAAVRAKRARIRRSADVRDYGFEMLPLKAYLDRIWDREPIRLALVGQRSSREVATDACDTSERVLGTSPWGRGLLVTGVLSAGPAANAGLSVGDFPVAVNDYSTLRPHSGNFRALHRPLSDDSESLPWAYKGTRRHSTLFPVSPLDLVPASSGAAPGRRLPLVTR